MSYGLSTVTAPAIEPVSLAEAKAHLRVDTTAEDDDILALISTGRALVEQHTRRALITQSLKLSLDSFGGVTNTIRLPRSPVQSITSIVYLDDSGVSQTLSASKYRLDAESLVARLTPAYGEEWPSTYPVTNAVTITFVAGYGLLASSVPAPIRAAVKLYLGTYYDPVRATVVIGTISSVLPHAVDHLLGPYTVPIDLEDP